MLRWPLTVRYRELPQHAAAAWIVPGDELALWIEEWLRWELPTTEWQVAVLPGWGVLTLLPSGQTPAVQPRAVPLGRASARWLLPLHAELVPAMQGEELEELLPRDYALAVFHPARGVLAVEPQELRSLADFFEAPPFRAQDWTAAQPGEALNDRLLGVQASSLPSLAEIMQAGRDDIGSQGSDLARLPPKPNEPGDGLIERAGRGLARGFYQAVSGLTKMLGADGGAASQAGGKPAPRRPAGGGQSAGAGWFQSLAQWATRRMSNMNQQLDDLRHREINRLMHLLQTNPDEGLKYALPFSAGGEHRGIAPPSGYLGAREVNFSLSRLGGGGPADVWNLSPQHQLQLMQRYRELANRELQLGRHRRAAYIFAELIGDLEAAASALQAGEHWREAAVLYRDRLNRPRAAAECLERGGLLQEAIELFEQQGAHEKVGDLYARLEQHEEAKTHWQAAASSYEGQRNYLQAAKLWEGKLQQPHEAASVLSRSWTAGNQRRESLEELFELFTRHGWHEQARAAIKALRDDYNTDVVAAAGSEALVTVVQRYPDRAVAAYAEDTARILVATHLTKADRAARTRLVAVLQGLVPADQVLQRDGLRYLRERDVLEAAPPLVKPPLLPPPTKSRAPQIVREFQLPRDGHWDAVAAQGEQFFAVGHQPRAIAGLCGTWEGQLITPAQPLAVPPVARGRQALLATDSQGHGPALAVYHPRIERSHRWQFGMPAGIRKMTLLPRTEPSAQDPHLLMAMAYAEHRLYAVRLNFISGMVHADGYPLPGNDQLGQITATFEVGMLRTDDPEDNSFLTDSPDFPVHGRSELLAVGLSNALILCRGGVAEDSIELPGRILQIVGSAPFTRTRLAVVTDRACSVFWLQGRDVSQPLECGHDLAEPLACFTFGGRLVLLGQTGGEIYDTTGGKLKLHARIPELTERPLALLPTNEPDQFAVFGPSGAVRVYRIVD